MKALHYAKALHGAFMHVPESSKGELFDRFKKILHARGHERLLPSILSAYQGLRTRGERQMAAVLYVARPEHAARYEAEAREAGKQFGFATESLRVEVDENLVGGYKLRQGELVLDKSYKTALIGLYRNIIS